MADWNAEALVTYSIIVAAGVQCLILWIGCFFNFMDGWTFVSWASQKGYTGCVQRLIVWGFEVHSQDNAGETAVMKASRRGHVEILTLLLEAKADPEVSNKKGRDPISVAAEKGHSGAVKRLLEAGAKPMQSPGEKKDAEPSLVLAAKGGHTDVVRLLCKHGSDRDVRGQMGRTPLIVACIRNHPACAMELLEAKADVELADSNGLTALIWASVHGRLDIVKLLVEHKANLNIHDKTNRSALMWAAVQLKWETANYLVKHGAVADESDLDQVTCDLQRTWRKPQKEIERIHTLAEEAWSLHGVAEARLAFLMGLSRGAGERSPVRLLRAPPAAPAAEPVTSKELLLKIIRFL
mmetsp:Transcript_16642/g.40999  ORF Transcript_16642/g.40999 Transcript_16642/m.40999 type:complete len:352 (+) Transcript_16642:238-1293(+)|eukprot:CAMPEP_0114508538 /NCGR_PEP_ID=MMETSP0109-20121206/12666_1 /TAXON_ID=29199 /ORGANISM="Chlorarachnion reptans, Strain CCCM449" /LENGTH=351 /DNA_ID=CAMNT_0001687503 /DNA_START=224 /DNA_END=1279 /DNA_ORIENTATION=+